jgi:hypothetical protein
MKRIKARSGLFSAALSIALLVLASSTWSTDFVNIRDNMNRMTSIAWGDYTKSLKGQTVNWNGWVKDVKQQWLGGYKLMIDMDPPGSMSVQDVYIENLPKAVAA